MLLISKPENNHNKNQVCQIERVAVNVFGKHGSITTDWIPQ